MKQIKITFFSAVAAIFLLASCQSEKSTPVTAAEAREFAHQLESSIERKDPAFFDNAISKKIFLKRANLPEKDVDASGLTLGQSMKLGTSILGSTTNKIQYKLVKQYSKDSVQHLLFRLYIDGSLNYHDMELIKVGKEVQIADMFVYLTGETLSQTVHSLYDQLKGEFNNNQAAQNSLDDLTEMKKKMSSEDYQGAVEAYNRLSKAVQDSRAVQVLYLNAVSMMDDAEFYNKSVDHFQKLYPNQPNMELLLLNGYILNHEYDRAMKGLNQLDNLIQYDPFLDYYRYLVYTLKAEPDSARSAIERVVKKYPDFEDGLLELIATYLQEKRKDDAAPYIKRFEQSIYFDQDRLKRTIERYQ